MADEGGKSRRRESPKPLPTSLWQLLDALCTAEQIQAVLRQYKPDYKNEVILSANKPDLIDNLKSLVGRRIVPISQVTGLICEAEENRSQHVFYYVAKNERIRKLARNGEGVAERIWGVDRDEGFPHFDLVPNDYRWSDFRVGLPGKPNDWIAKIYGHRVHQHATGHEYEEDGLLYKEFAKHEERIICLARWNDPRLLEIHVQAVTGRHNLIARRDKVWEMLGDGLARDDFVPWNLESARRRLVDEEEANKEIYSLGPAILFDSDRGTVSFHPHTPHEKLGAAPERKAALKAYSRNECNDLAITWLHGGSNGNLADKETLRTVCGGSETNELSILAHTSSKAVDYVTNRLRQFSG